jgi:hypothetical protein
MMAENVDWKQVSDTFRTGGTILEAGSFITANGHKVDISEQDVDYFLNSLNKPVPMVIDHDGYAETIGYAIKFAKNENSIEHGGFVFESDDFKEAIATGYNFISPEIDYSYDENGNVVDKKIVKLAFVRNPAIKSTHTKIQQFAFSAPEVTPMSNEGTGTITSAPSIDFAELTKNITESIMGGLSEKIDSRLDGIQSEINGLKLTSTPLTPSVTETPKVEDLASTPNDPSITPEFMEKYAALQSELNLYKIQTEKVLKEQYTNVLGELRNMNVETPEKLVSHLPDLKQKIDTLNAMKVTVLKTTPMNSTKSEPMSNEGGNKDKVTISGLAGSLRLNLSDEMAEKVAKKLNIPIS